METQWINEQEASFAWLVNSSATEQEDAMDWIKSIGVGAAQGAGTGAAAGPWGALIGGLIGGGLGALQQATQPAPQRPANPPGRPAAQAAAAPPTAPSPAPSVPPAATNSNTAGAMQQIVQLLPQLLQLIQTAQQTRGRSGESAEQAETMESLAGDHVPDSAFLENLTENEPIQDLCREDGSDEEPQLSQYSASDTPELIPTTLSRPPFTRQAQVPTLAFPNEWSTEAESASFMATGFQWVS